MTGTGDLEHKDPQIALVLTKIGALREVMELRFTAVDKAQLIDTRETQRRLEELNHAHAQGLIDKEKFLPRETFDLFVRELRIAEEKTRGDVRESATKLSETLAASVRQLGDNNAAVSSRISNLEGRLAAYSIAIVIGLTIMEIMLRVLLPK